MGIRERHSRERETVTRKILDAARTLFLSEGYANVSMRKIADQIEYSPGAIYSYFRSKEDIFFALAEEGLECVRAHCGARVSDPFAASASTSGQPLDRVRDTFWRFYTFSREQPEYFRLVFVDSAVPRISRDWEHLPSMRELRQDVEHDIQECMDQGVFPGVESAGAIFRILWTAVYGAAVFRLSHRLHPNDDADALAHDLLACTIAGLRSGVRLRFSTAVDTAEPDEISARRSLEL